MNDSEVVLFFTKQRAVGSILIRWFTGSEVSHVGFLLRDGMVLDSTFTHGGVKVRKLSKKEYKRATFCNVVSSDYEEIISAARKEVGKKYDYTGSFGHFGRLFVPTNWDNKKRWYCSELIVYSFSKGYDWLFTQFQGYSYTPRDIRINPRLREIPKSEIEKYIKLS